MEFLSKHKRGILTFVFLVVSFVLILFNNSKYALTFERIGFTLVYPFQFTFNSIFKGFNDVVNSVNEIKVIKNELENNRIELEEYRKVIKDFTVLNQENLRLKEILQLRNELVYDSVAASIVNRNSNSVYDYLIIDKGSSNGLKDNMPVISYYNGKKVLIGKIDVVSLYSSKVITVNNLHLKIGAYIPSKGIHFILQGYPNIEYMAKALYLSKELKIDNNESLSVYTSGDSLIYPKGLEIGELVKINEKKDYEVFNEGIVKLFTDFSKIDYVIVLKVDYKKDDFKMME